MPRICPMMKANDDWYYMLYCHDGGWHSMKQIPGEVQLGCCAVEPMPEYCIEEKSAKGATQQDVPSSWTPLEADAPIPMGTSSPAIEDVVGLEVAKVEAEIGGRWRPFKLFVLSYKHVSQPKPHLVRVGFEIEPVKGLIRVPGATDGPYAGTCRITLGPDADYFCVYAQ